MTAGRISVRWANESHRFLAGIEVTLSAGGQVVPPVAGRGKSGKPRLGFYQFDVDPLAGTSFELSVRVPPPAAKKGKPTFDFPLVELTQKFHIEGEATPVPESPASGWHPRVRPITAAGAGKGGLVGLQLDLSFIDVTAYCLATRTKDFTDYFFRSFEDHTEESGGKRFFRADDFGGCALRLLQHTAGEPGVFSVLVSPGFDGSERTVDGALFQKPSEKKGYKDVDDVGLFSLVRYMTSYSDGTAWDYAGGTYCYGKVEDDGWFGYFHPTVFSEPPRKIAELPDEYVDRGSCGYPRCRFAQQVGRSGKKAIFVMPIANESNFGVTGGPNLRARWTSILACLQGEGLIGGASRAEVTLRKLAIGGFSAGGEVAFAAFQANREDIDEVWMLDPKGLAANWSGVVEWCKGERRARFVGGMHLPFLHARRAELKDDAPAAPTGTIPESPGTATVWPRHLGFFRRSEVYARAYALVGETGPWEPVARKFDTITQAEVSAKGAKITTAPVELATRKTGIREVIMEPGPKVDDDAVHLVAILPNESPTPIEALKFGNCTQMAERFLVTVTEPIQTAKEFRELCERFRKEMWIGLHQWVVIGGQSVGDQEDPDEWSGYLELCLRFSSFADR